jgi:hypothetical protein
MHHSHKHTTAIDLSEHLQQAIANAKKAHPGAEITAEVELTEDLQVIITTFCKDPDDYSRLSKPILH